MQTASWWRRPLLLAGGVFLKFAAHEVVLVDAAVRSQVLTVFNWRTVCARCVSLR